MPLGLGLEKQEKHYSHTKNALLQKHCVLFIWRYNNKHELLSQTNETQWNVDTDKGAQLTIFSKEFMEFYLRYQVCPSLVYGITF